MLARVGSPRLLKPGAIGSRRPQGCGSGSSGTDGRVTGMVSTLLSVPEPLDDWLPDVGPLEELEPGWDLGWDGDWVDWVDWVDWAWDGDKVDWAWDGNWVDWGWSPSLGASSDISQPCRINT